MRSVHRDRPGDQGEEPTSACVHDRTSKRLQRLSADARRARARRLRDVASAIELFGGERVGRDRAIAVGVAKANGPVKTFAEIRRAHCGWCSGSRQTSDVARTGSLRTSATPIRNALET